MSSDDYDFLYNYAIEQAERVQELEVEQSKNDEYTWKLLMEIKRLREVLEKIADKREVDFGNSYTNRVYNHSRKLARQALEGGE